MDCPDCGNLEWAEEDEIKQCTLCGFRAHKQWFEVTTPEDIEFNP